MRKCIFILVFLLSACTSVTIIKPVPFQINIKNKYPSIGLLVNGGHHIDSGCYSNTCYSLSDRTPELVSKEFYKTNNFKSILLQNQNLDWVIDVNLEMSKSYVEGSKEASLAATVLTLGVVPTTAVHEYTAEIKILYKNEHIKSYTYKQNVDDVNSVFVDVQSSDFDAAMLLMARFFQDIERNNPFILTEKNT